MQVVGQGRTNPMVPGTAAIRLTHAARSALARRCTIQWDDVLFAPSLELQLDQALAHARLRTEILPGRPTFPGQGAGRRLLLSGVPGTGRSMASEALASTLDRPLITLDLSAVLSRWLPDPATRLRLWRCSRAARPRARTSAIRSGRSWGSGSAADGAR